MRKLGVLCVLLLTTAVATAQAPPPEPVGTLAEVMRSILFPNSNILFDVQMRDPDAPPEAAAADGTATSTFASIYTGWPLVQSASVALGESAQLIVMPGRLCENGRAVPVGQDEFQQYARELVDVSRRAYEIAKARDLDAMVEITNDVAGACENCHMVYRRYEDRCAQ